MEYLLIKAKDYHQTEQIKTIVYVDGFNFYYRALKAHPSFKWIDPLRLCKNILNKEHKYVGLKYFSATVNNPPHDPSKSQRQQMYFRALKTIPNTEIILGHFSIHKKWMNLATPIKTSNNQTIRKAEVIKYEEKGSDVNIASEILIDAYENKYDAAVLISNDSDLTRPIQYVKKKLKKKVIVLNPQKEKRSMQLNRYSTVQKDISEKHLKMSLFPEKLKDDRGWFTKPSSW